MYLQLEMGEVSSPHRESMSQLHLLYRLQQIDDEIRAKKQRLREVLNAQKKNGELVAARASKKKSDSRLQKARNRQKDLELELGSVSDKARRTEERLYSGKVQNTKELRDLQEGVASLGRRRSVLEDEILDVMMVVEEVEAENEEVSAELAEIEAEWEQTVAGLQEEQNELAVRVNQLLEQRQEQVGKIEQPLLTSYRAVGERRRGIAVAAVKDGLCEVCGVRISANKVQAARMGEVVDCGSCGRILVVV